MRHFASALIAVALLVSSMPAIAQDLGDVPSPDQLEGADASLAPLRIDSPVDGEQVKTPFTVNGAASPGARLELWLGDRLERVFLADANGRFSSAVAAVSAAEIHVHQVDSRGKRLQSASVFVALAGAAPKLAAPVKPPTGAATPVGASEPVPDPPALVPDPPPPSGATGATTSAGLPKVSGLDDTEGTFAPTPPPPSSDVFAPERSDAPVAVEATVAVAPTGGPKVRTERWVRVIGESGGGLAGAAVFGLVGVLAGAGIGAAAAPDSFAPLIGGVFGGIGGLAIGLPVGVIFTGNLLDGNGKWYAVIAGEALGILAGVGTTAACYGCAGGAAMLIVLPIAGAVIGYEITSDASAYDAKHPKLTWTPTVTPTRDGGFTMGFDVRF